MSEVHETPSDKKIEFESLQSPEALLAFLKENTRYGFVGKNNKTYTSADPEMDKDFQKEYFLQSPEELLESGYGVCWDMVELERRWLNDHGYSPETYFMMFAKEGGTDLPTHTFAVYEKDGKWFWLEHAFADQQGIHEYPDRDSLIKDIQAKHYEYAHGHRGATPDDFNRLRVAPYNQPTFGSSPEAFVGGIISENPELISSE